MSLGTGPVFPDSTTLAVGAGGLAGIVYGVYSGRPAVVIGAYVALIGWNEYRSFAVPYAEKTPMAVVKRELAPVLAAVVLSYWASKRGAAKSSKLLGFDPPGKRWRTGRMAKAAAAKRLEMQSNDDPSTGEECEGRLITRGVSPDDAHELCLDPTREYSNFQMEDD